MDLSLPFSDLDRPEPTGTVSLSSSRTVVSAGVSAPLPSHRPSLHAAEESAVLALTSLSHRYGRTPAVAGVSLAIRPGEIVCLVGPSGCGKSTLLRLAAGLEPVQAGSVAVAGRVVGQPGRCEPPERRGVGLVFQDYALFPHLTVLENVRFGLRGLSRRRQGERARAVLALVGMAERADAYPHTLSGGQQQRIALARALAPRPAVLLLDEPFSGLDATLRQQVRADTLAILKREQVATLLVTHDPEEAMFLGDRLAVMREGRLVQVDSPIDVYTRPANAFVARFFGEVNRMTGVLRDGAVATPFGTVVGANRFEGCCLKDGTPVEVLVRPDGVHLDGAPWSGAADPTAVCGGCVDGARLLGRASLIHVRVSDGQGGQLRLAARIPGQYLPPPESAVAVRLDRRQAFVFPLSPCG